MALLEVNFFSKALLRNVSMNVILPIGKFELPNAPVEGTEDKPFKTLYLLHGLFGNYTDWVSQTSIQSYAEEKNLSVVMPSGDNSFYLDRPESWRNYGEFVGQELVEVTRKMFRLSHNSDSTFIGGLSMGGFGAIRNGLKYHETFGYIIGLSSAVHILEDIANVNNRNITYEESCYGPLREALHTDNNPRVIVKNLKKKQTSGENIRFPKIYLACGTEDELIGVNRAYRDFLIDNGLDVTYLEESGEHNWAFWDKHIMKALEWLSL